MRRRHGSTARPATVSIAAMRTAVIVAALLGIAGCGSGTSDPLGPQPVVAAPPGPTTLRVADLAPWGPVLTDGAGYALYMFPPDGRQVVSCIDECAGSWPPVLLQEADVARADLGVEPSRIGALPSPNGGQVVTYDGWPLYTYAADIAPGQTSGQGLDLNGGPWYLVRPDGRVVVPPEQAAQMASGDGMSGMGRTGQEEQPGPPRDPPAPQLPLPISTAPAAPFPSTPRGHH